MMNTDNQAVIASFNASGSGSDTYLGKADVRHVPDIARVRKEILASFSEDARKKLMEQLPKPGATGIVPAQTTVSGTQDAFSEGDPKTMKVYRNLDKVEEVGKGKAAEEKRRRDHLSPVKRYTLSLQNPSTSKRAELTE